MRLHIQSGKDFLNVDLDMDNRHTVERSADSQSRTINLNQRLNSYERKALKALYVLNEEDFGHIFTAIQGIAREAFLAGQKMNKYV